MKEFELLPDFSTPTVTGAHPLRWWSHTPTTESVHTSISWSGHELGLTSTAANDLMRIACAAYLADRLTARPRSFSRRISITVQIEEPDRWSSSLVSEMQRLLTWLTGDNWTVSLVQAQNVPSVPTIQTTLPIELPALDEVVMLSGGLDSLAGAALVVNNHRRRLFLSVSDGTRSVLKAQRHVKEWVESVLDNDRSSFTAITFYQGERKREASSRSRSLLYMSLTIAHAASLNASQVIVPENGYTSINPPLTPSRGGALSTRSTHPTTFWRLNSILRQLELPIAVSNPHSSITKGKLVQQAIATGLPGFTEAVANSISCGKPSASRFIGGNPNLNCGLCIPCIVRRGSILGAGISDPTKYLCTTMAGAELQQLVESRNDDTMAVRLAIADPPQEAAIIACGPWPLDFNIDQAQELCHDGLQEIARVPLP